MRRGYALSAYPRDRLDLLSHISSLFAGFFIGAASDSCVTQQTKCGSFTSAIPVIQKQH
jgi:hypothetical protein